jgi:hypothetical protein
MGNLIPQLRQDINGKLVTRHVKDDVQAPQSRRPFAAPSIKAQPAEMSQKDIEKARPLKKVKKRKVVASRDGIAALRVPSKMIEAGVTEMSDENVYKYLKSGLTISEAAALHSIGVDAHVWRTTPEQGEDETDSVYSARMARFNSEEKRIYGRMERFSDVGHRLESRDIPADIAGKCLENGLTMKALSGYLEAKEVCEIYSKVGYLKSNMKVMDDLVNGVIPFEHYQQFGIRNLNNWERNCPVYSFMSSEVIARAVEKAGSPYPGIETAVPNDSVLIKLAAEDERVLDLRLGELMWHGFRTERDGGKFSYEEAKVVDDFIHEVRSRGITDLTERPRTADRTLKDFYPDAGQWDSSYECGKILDWHNAGLSTDQIISGFQNRWNKEQAVSVYLEDTAASLASGIL